MPLSEVDRHDRSRRFIRNAFPWERGISDNMLMASAAKVRVTLRLSADPPSSPSDQLIILAAANMLLRLPFPTTFSIPADEFSAPPAPYEGRTLRQAIQKLGGKLDVPIRITDAPKQGGVSILIEIENESLELWLVTTGWMASLKENPQHDRQVGNPLSSYAVAAMATAESVRVWARSAAREAGEVSEQFERAAGTTTDAHINLWRPGTSEDGPRLEGLRIPSIDWVGGGAVTQAALAVLVAVPGLDLTGRIFDPKDIDEPDLNRSILSFVSSIDSPKPDAISMALPERCRLEGVNGPFPPDEGQAARWIVCGADDVAIRPTCQSLWPQNLIVVATENQFAQVSTHTPHDHYFCGGCFTEGTGPDGPAPTIVSTSVMSGVVGAAVLARLALRDTPPARTDILTMRLDSPLALSEVTPAANPECPTCHGRRRAS